MMIRADEVAARLRDEGITDEAIEFALQRGREFSRAEELYRQVLVKGGGRDAEVCWRMLLCHYCVEYQRDEDGRLVPTILNPDMSDPGELPERQALPVLLL